MEDYCIEQNKAQLVILLIESGFIYLHWFFESNDVFLLESSSFHINSSSQFSTFEIELIIQLENWLRSKNGHH